PCRSATRAREARAALEGLLLPAGMAMKRSLDTSIRDLNAGAVVHWLGVSIEKPARGLAMRIGERSWESLEEQLALCHAERDAPLQAAATIRGWLSQRGPSYRWSDRPEVLRRIGAIAAGQAFDEIDATEAMETIWRDAHGRWQLVRERI